MTTNKEMQKTVIEHAIKLHADYHNGHSGLSDKDCLETILSVIEKQRQTLIKEIEEKVEEFCKGKSYEDFDVDDIKQILTNLREE